jgi:sucrose-6F-phosphate phosphohydrolase
MERLGMLVSDLDGTLLGDTIALKEFAAWRRHAGTQMRIVYSSGRFLRSVRESIKAFGLPAPDAVICGVGTEIHDFRETDAALDWPVRLEGWNPDIIKATCLDHGKLTLQPGQFLSPHKLSFYGMDLEEAYLKRLRLALSAAGQAVTMVYSSRRDLDVLPRGVNKGTAAAFLAQRWGMEPSDVIVAGDSGNDLAMFEEGFPGIIVGNAQSELRRFQGRNAYHATRHFAAGVLEGLRHWRADLGASRLQAVN